jgi:TfoX/Sxy family transcriptional regulator of competence genes
MAYNENLADRIREILEEQPNLEEKKMMGGLCFMVNNKMCVGIMKDELMCRIDPDVYEASLEKRGCREMAMGGKTMKGYVLVDETGTKTKKELESWITLALEFNPKARSSKKKK